MNLNIIGNGFDLYHGLPTTYYDFACYILSHDEEFYILMANMFGFSYGISRGFPSDEIDFAIDDLGYWRYFEEKLGYLNPLWLEGSLVDDLHLEIPDAVDLEVEGSENVDEIKRRMSLWIDNYVDVEENYLIVKNNIGEARINLSEEDAWVSFNYTHTLEKVYGIEDVLHIHGEGHSNELLIIGHGNDEAIENLKENLSKLEENTFDQASRNRENEYLAEIDILESLRKPVYLCISDLKRYIEYYPSINNIIVWGMSLSDVDMPYLQAIHEKFPGCKWQFSYYENDKAVKRVVNKLGIEKNKYSIFKFRNDNSRIIRDKIIKARNIKVYPTIEGRLKHIM